MNDTLTEKAIDNRPDADADADALAVERFLLTRERFGMRFGLDRMRRLLAVLGDPQDEYPAVHVVGTNGKSSTTLMIGAAMTAQRLKVGCFTSPHLRCFRERIALGDSIAGAEAFAEAGTRVRAAIESLDACSDADDRVTQFEAIAAIAFRVFAEERVELAVVEAGLGGRLDATNVLGDSRVQVLTGIGVDHTEYLGETIEEIAHEKLAVVRSRGTLVCGRLGAAAERQANNIADERDARLVHVREEDSAFAGLPGAFVRRNASLAIAAAEVAAHRLRPGLTFDITRGAGAIADFVVATRLEGRLQVTNVEPFELRDAAHNEEAAEALIESLPDVVGERTVTLLVAMMSDKRIGPTLSVLLGAVGADDVVVCTQSSNPRSVTADRIAAEARSQVPAGVRIEVEPSPFAALDRAREIAGRDGALLVTGSNYLLADLARGPATSGGATL
ncbi:MAG: Mur ligase family protein [Solirubrobacterales bacterium]